MTVLMPTLYYRTWAKNEAPISIEIRQHLLTSCTKVFWCVFMPHSVLEL